MNRLLVILLLTPVRCNETENINCFLRGVMKVSRVNFGTVQKRGRVGAGRVIIIPYDDAITTIITFNYCDSDLKSARKANNSDNTSSTHIFARAMYRTRGIGVGDVPIV